MGTPVSCVVNTTTQLKIAPLAAGTFVKPAALAFKAFQNSNDIQISWSDSAVDLSTYGTALAMQDAKVGSQATAQVSLIVKSTDVDFNTIVLPAGNNASTGTANVYVEITDAGGRVYSFPAQVRNLNLNMQVREVLRASFSLVSIDDVVITNPV
jgi:uncharacterized protein (UPF0333 family)